ncbi:hypothetical protein H5410_027623 [Solanum commersonii]|uniref:Uncharacterized protein n=1 Tax=Solanum commersonii TaxID=4109 RepID=A0A9J5YZP9_SOLCO|nr:hypothetical protein H5410_027623 [Solanum commersonii]
MNVATEGNLHSKDIPISSQSSFPAQDVEQVQIQATERMQQGHVAELNPSLEQRKSGESTKDDHTSKIHGNVTGKPPNTKSNSPVADLVNSSQLNANVSHRIDKDKRVKGWVPKDDNPRRVRQDQDDGLKSLTNGDQNKLAYQSNFPRISSNFDKVVPKFNPPPAKIDQHTVPEPSPYTVVQTYADRLRSNQAKSEVPNKLTTLELTTK